MRHKNYFQKSFVVMALFGALFQFAHAGVADNAIKTWNTPVPEGVYQYTDTISFQGTVQIPAGWIGRVRVCKDVGGATCRTAYVGSLAYDNTSTATTTETFSVNTGVWASGAHTARVAFDGAMACRLTCTDTDYACQTANNSDGDQNNDWCPQTTENQVIDQQYPVRNITVGPPPLPSLSVDSSPLHFWDHVVGSGVVTETVTLMNVGAVGTVAVGSVSQLSGAGRFSCQSGCSYSINSGDSHTVTFALTPPESVDDWSGSFSLSCAGCIATNQTLDVDGTTIDVPSEAEISLGESELDFGFVNLGSRDEEWITVTNSGGTTMTGTIDLSNAQVYCDDTCDFSLNAGEDVSKRLYYEPTIAGVLSGVTATFRATSGGADPITIPLYGEGNDQPYLSVWSYDTWDDIDDGDEIEIDRINMGDTGVIELGVYNSGAGILSASMAGLPLGVFTCISECGPYTIQSYDQTGDEATLRIQVTLPDASEQVLSLTFTDTTPGGSGRTISFTIRVIPNSDPVSEMVGNYPCNLNFGNVLAGDSTLPLPDPDTDDGYNHQEECGVRNAGVGSLTVTIPSFTLNGTGRYDCVVGVGYSCGTFSLSAGEEARFTYRFTALAGDPDTSMHHWDPVGYISAFEGLPSGDSIHVHASPMSMSLAVTAESDPAYDFSTVNVSETSSDKSYLLFLDRVGGRDNTMYYSALPGSVSYVVGDTAHFRCTQHCSETLSFTGSNEEDVRVVFEPGVDTGAITETMSIPYVFGGWTNHPVETPLMLDLVGEGNDQPVLEVSGEISPSLEVDFGSVNITTSQSRSITLRNIGVGDLTGTFSPAPAPFSCNGSDCNPFVIPSGGSRDVGFVFTPPSGVPYEESVTLTTDGAYVMVVSEEGPTGTWTHAADEYEDFRLFAPAMVRYGAGSTFVTMALPAGDHACDNAVFGDPVPSATKECEVDPASALTAPVSLSGGNQTLTLRGEGKLEPELTVSTNFINFDTLTDPASQTNVGDVRGATVRVTNTGMVTMFVTARLTAPTSNFLFPAQTFSLDAGEGADLSVQFSPIRDSVLLSGQLTVSASDGVAGGWSDTDTISLAGTGAFASLTDFRGPPPNFGPVVFGKDKTLTITLRNAGVRPLGQGTFTFPSGSPFECIASCEYDIGPNGEHALTVKFTPQRLGAVAFEMGLSSLPEYTIEFTGTGVPPRFNYKEQ